MLGSGIHSGYAILKSVTWSVTFFDKRVEDLPAAFREEDRENAAKGTRYRAKAHEGIEKWLAILSGSRHALLRVLA